MPTRVIILGGVAGMCAAHELSERGFEDMVLESGDLARGKPYSIPLVHEGYQRTSAREWRGGFDRAPGAGRSRVSIFPRFLQPRHRHHPPHAVI